MPRKKKRTKKRGKSARRASIQKRFDLAWKNLVLFLILFILSFILYSFSSNSLLLNFFGVLSIIFGFLTFAFLVSLIILAILKSGRK